MDGIIYDDTSKIVKDLISLTWQKKSVFDIYDEFGCLLQELINKYTEFFSGKYSKLETEGLIKEKVVRNYKLSEEKVRSFFYGAFDNWRGYLMPLQTQLEYMKNYEIEEDVTLCTKIEGLISLYNYYMKLWADKWSKYTDESLKKAQAQVLNKYRSYYYEENGKTYIREKIEG